MFQRYAFVLGCTLLCLGQAVSQTSQTRGQLISGQQSIFGLKAQQDAPKRNVINMQLATFLQTADPAQMVDLFLEGDAQQVARVVLAHGGYVKMATNNWCNVRMPAGRIRELNNEQAVRGIQFDLDRPITMNDSARYKTRIDLIQQGLAPLMQAYDGTGVVMGLVDTGLDFHHPDFLDSLGNTRLISYWEQNMAVNALTPQPYGYGQEFDTDTLNAALAANTWPVNDQVGQNGHGTTVAGAAAGNGGLTHRFIGAAPQADIIIVSSNFNAANYSSTVVDGIDYIFNKASAVGKPAVVNISLGDYYGSHDALDAPTLLMENMLNTPGRMVVCAAGNSGNIGPYHLHTDVTSDTSFTWFKVNNNSVLNIAAVYFDLWADTADFNDVSYSIAADRHTGAYGFRGRIPFANIEATIDTDITDSLYSVDGNYIGSVITHATVRGGQYHLEVAVPAPDSADYYFRFETVGNGSYDTWSYAPFGTSEMVSTALPSQAVFPPIANYVLPDNTHTIVDAWACSERTLTVANHLNEQSYIDCNDTLRVFPGTEGALSITSSRGPTRTGYQKPDVAAPSDITMSAGPLDFLGLLITFQPFKVAQDSMHFRNGGTSMASPWVAGTAALYLEKCPMANWEEIRDAVINTAVTDAFTGTVPNISWGYGKLDSYAALVESNYQAEIYGGPGTCGEDSIMLQTGPFLHGYDWSTGSSTYFTYAQPGLVTLSVINNSGCLSLADSVMVIDTPPATPPTISADGADMTSSPGVTYQWWFGGTPIPGATDQTYTALENGNYTVTITDVNGCEATSVPYVMLTVGVEEVVTEGARIWPSPTHDVLNVQLSEGGAAEFEVIDASGRVMRRERATGTLSQVSVQGLSSGAYVLRIRQSGEVRSVRFEVR